MNPNTTRGRTAIRRVTVDVRRIEMAGAQNRRRLRFQSGFVFLLVDRIQLLDGFQGNNPPLLFSSAIPYSGMYGRLGLGNSNIGPHLTLDW